MQWGDVATCGLFAQETSHLENGVEVFHPSPILPLKFFYDDGVETHRVVGIMKGVDDNFCIMITEDDGDMGEHMHHAFSLDEDFDLDVEINNVWLIAHRVMR